MRNLRNLASRTLLAVTLVVAAFSLVGCWRQHGRGNNDIHIVGATRLAWGEHWEHPTEGTFVVHDHTAGVITVRLDVTVASNNRIVIVQTDSRPWQPHISAGLFVRLVIPVPEDFDVDDFYVDVQRRETWRRAR